MFRIEECTDHLNAIVYDGGEYVKIRICYPKYDSIREQYAIVEFWKEFERQSINSRITHSITDILK